MKHKGDVAMFFKKMKKACCLLLLSLFSMPLSLLAYSDYIIPGGENIGIQLNATGVMVVGSYKVKETYPAKEAGLQTGDIILSINEVKVSNINEMIKEINNSKSTTIKIKYKRQNEVKETSLPLIKDDNDIIKTGLYVKDSISGIGTLSYIDPETKLYGALGHEIIEKTTGKILEIKDGSIYESEVTGVEKSENGNPGEKIARFDTNDPTGTIHENTSSGIFGTYTGKLPDKAEMKVAKPEEIELGKAQIMTVLDSQTVQTFDIKITNINRNPSQKTKNIIFEVTDSKLLSKTGGIVQGMSGSPIIQNDKIIGAVTHVVIDDPTKGYGIFITNMLEEAENEK